MQKKISNTYNFYIKTHRELKSINTINSMSCGWDRLKNKKISLLIYHNIYLCKVVVCLLVYLFILCFIWVDWPQLTIMSFIMFLYILFLFLYKYFPKLEFNLINKLLIYSHFLFSLVALLRIFICTLFLLRLYFFIKNNSLIISFYWLLKLTFLKNSINPLISKLDLWVVEFQVF